MKNTMEANTIKKLLGGENLSTEEVAEVIQAHQELFGTEYFPFDLKDGVAIKFFAQRVAKFYAGDKDIMKTHNQYLEYKKNNKPKTVKQLLATDVITKNEFQILVDNHTKLFGSNGFNFEYSIDAVNRLKKKLKGYYDGDLATLKYHQDYKESLIIKSNYTDLELMSKVKTTDEDEKRIWKIYDRLFPDSIEVDRTISRNLRLAKFQYKYLL